MSYVPEAVEEEDELLVWGDEVLELEPGQDVDGHLPANMEFTASKAIPEELEDEANEGNEGHDAPKSNCRIFCKQHISDPSKDDRG